jgi:hypothetical protein
MKLQRRERICRSCGEPYNTRAGRGLCNPCWRNPAIRAQFQPLANFGGAEASKYATALAKDEEPSDESAR